MSSGAAVPGRGSSQQQPELHAAMTVAMARRLLDLLVATIALAPRTRSSADGDGEQMFDAE